MAHLLKPNTNNANGLNSLSSPSKKPEWLLVLLCEEVQLRVVSARKSQHL